MASAKESWRIEGEYFESCNCVVLCPCLLSNATARPTDGHCDVVLAYHVRSGNYGKIDLAGLNVVQAITTPGPMAQGGGTLALYVDSRANDLQRPALEAIFIGAAAGRGAELVEQLSRPCDEFRELGPQWSFLPDKLGGRLSDSDAPTGNPSI